MLLVGYMLLCFCYLAQAQRDNASTVIIDLPASVIPSNEACPVVNQSALSSTAREALQDYVIQRRPCSCGGEGWTRVVHLDMSDPNQQCPPGWMLNTWPVRGCGRVNPRPGTCDSNTFFVSRSFSSVCGRVVAVQKAASRGLRGSIAFNRGIDEAYLDGASLTYGPSNSRTHIWSFIGADYETNANYNTETNCPCTNTDVTWPHQFPSFIAGNYFCDTGNPGPTLSNNFFLDDPLWDGRGCGSSSSCCTLNTPPWFCRSLPSTVTREDLELRNCFTDDTMGGGDRIITLVELYVK